MAPPSKGLTALKVKAASPGLHCDGKGLYLDVKPSGSRSWILRVQHLGRRRDIGLGSVDILTLAEAREKASHLRKLAKQGLDPVAERDKGKRVIPTFAQAVDRAHADLSAEWADKTAAQFKATMELYAKPMLGRTKVSDITTDQIVAALKPIWRDKPSQARKARHWMIRVLRYAKGHGWYPGALPEVALIGDGLGKRPKGGHFEAMPHAEVPAFVASHLAKPDTPARLALLFTVLTAARSGEVRAAEWSQIDRAARTWSRPAEMMKSDKPHVVALSRAAIAILDRAAEEYGEAGLIFPSVRTKTALSDNALSKMLRDEGRSVTVHGFRSTFRDWAAERMPAIPWNVAELALAHSVGGEVEKAYQRSDLLKLRFRLMDAWGGYAAPGLSGSKSNVVSIGAES